MNKVLTKTKLFHYYRRSNTVDNDRDQETTALLHVTWKITSATSYLAAIDGKTSGPGRFDGPIGKQLQDFKFSSMKTTALLYATWESTPVQGKSATRY